MAEPHTNLGWWLKRVWGANGRILYDDLRTDVVTGEELRGFLRCWIEWAPRKRHRVVHEIWDPLTEEQKEQALLEAFPNAEYPLPPDDAEEE